MNTLWTIVGIISFLGGAYLLYRYSQKRKAKRRAGMGVPVPMSSGTSASKSTGKKPPKK